MEEDAYAKLQSPTFLAYLKKMRVTLGRGDTTEEHISIGESKKISRIHALIYWEPDLLAFNLRCIGKNPIIVDK